jgi:ProP effector
MTKRIKPEQIAEAEKLLIVLQEEFPNTFSNDPEKIYPLKINIHRDIHARLVHHYSKKHIRRALHLYTSQLNYRHKLIVNAPRIDLEGNFCEIVTEDHIAIGEEVKQKQRRIRTQTKIAPSVEKATPAPLSLLGRPVLSLKRVSEQGAGSKENTMDNTTAYHSNAMDTPVVPGNLEVNIKIYTLPATVQTVKNGWQQFTVEADGQMVLMKIRPKIWKKMQYAAENYPAWVVSITGKIGRRIKNGFELLQPAVQIFEKKLKTDNSADDSADSGKNGVPI